MWLVLPIYLARIPLFRTPSHSFYVLSSSILTFRERGQPSSTLSYSIFTTCLASSALSSFTLTSVCSYPHSSPASPPSILSVTPTHISQPRPLAPNDLKISHRLLPVQFVIHRSTLSAALTSARTTWLEDDMSSPLLQGKIPPSYMPNRVIYANLLSPASASSID